MFDALEERMCTWRHSFNHTVKIFKIVAKRPKYIIQDCNRERVTVRENQRMSMRDLEVLSSIDPITTTSTGDSE